METVKDAYYFGFVSLSVGYDEEELEDALEQNITCFFIILTINEQIQNIAQKKDTLCRRMYN